MRLNSIATASLLVILFLTASCNAASIKTIDMDYPHGTDRLLIRANGETYLHYASLPQHKKIKTGTFTVEGFYNQLKDRLHDNTPRETWPNPRSIAGMVQITFSNGREKDYLIFDEEEFAGEIFKRAKENMIGDR